MLALFRLPECPEEIHTQVLARLPSYAYHSLTHHQRARESNMFVYYSYPYELAVNVEESPTCSSIILYLYEVIIVATSPDRKRFTSLAHTQKFRKIDQYPAPAPDILCSGHGTVGRTRAIFKKGTASTLSYL